MSKITALVACELDVYIHYDFQPFEPQTLEHPGCRAEIEYMSVWVGDTEITAILDDAQLNELMQKCLEAEVKDPNDEANCD